MTTLTMRVVRGDFIVTGLTANLNAGGLSGALTVTTVAVAEPSVSALFSRPLICTS